ncbi:Helicase associated domain protein [Streptomyces cinereoruber]|uniref:Helicase associated domain protein n=1 Tax=Streptomyces cinereoruber TaxID=67260 RepID=UPI00362CD3CD
MVAPATEAAGHLGAASARTAGAAGEAGRTPRPGARSRPSSQPRGEGPSKAQQERGLAALTQWVEREGDRPVPRKAVEVLPDGTETKLGIWYSNTKTRRDKLNQEQRDALRELGVGWV